MRAAWRQDSLAACGVGPQRSGDLLAQAVGVGLATPPVKGGAGGWSMHGQLLNYPSLPLNLNVYV